MDKEKCRQPYLLKLIIVRHTLLRLSSMISYLGICVRKREVKLSSFENFNVHKFIINTTTIIAMYFSTPGLSCGFVFMRAA